MKKQTGCIIGYAAVFWTILGKATQSFVLHPFTVLSKLASNVCVTNSCAYEYWYIQTDQTSIYIQANVIKRRSTIVRRNFRVNWKK